MRLWCVVATKTDGLCASRGFLSAARVARLEMSLLCAEVEPLVNKEPISANVAAFHLDIAKQGDSCASKRTTAERPDHLGVVCHQVGSEGLVET